MPPRKSSPQPTERVLTVDEQHAAIGRLEARIKELRQLDVSNLQTGDDPPVRDLEQRIKSTHASIYGESSRQYGRLNNAAASLDKTPMS